MKQWILISGKEKENIVHYRRIENYEVKGVRNKDLLEMRDSYFFNQATKYLDILHF